MRPFDPQLLRAAPAARRPVVALAVVGVLQGVATIATAFALTAVVLAVVKGMPVGRPGAWLAGLFALRAALSWTSERVSAWAGSRVSAALREQLLAAWLRADADRRPDPSHAVALAAQGTSSVEPYVAKYLPALVTAAVVPPLAIATLAVVDWPSALIVVLTVPLLPVFAALIGASTRDATQRRWQALSALSGHFLDVMRGLPTLVGYGRATRQVETISSVSQRHRRTTMETLRLAFLSSAALELLATISVAMVAVTVGIRLSHGSVALGTGLVAILLAPEAYWPIRRVGAEFHAAADGAEALADIQGHLATGTGSEVAAAGAGRDDAARRLAASLARPATVVASGLTYTYPGTTVPVLDGVSLTAGPGLTVLTGPSGTGKTTLLEVLAGIRVPQAGTLSTPAAHLVSQRPFLTADTVRSNLALGTAAGQDACWQALRDVGLDGVVAAMPQGLDTRIGDDGFGLSAGQRARLVLARATLSEATVVLLDEPTAHLDPESAGIAHEAIRTLAARRCVVAVSHRPELVAAADAHVHLEQGRTTHSDSRQDREAQQ
ncbi:ATP-binding cassette, subfamily C, CydD/ATP-binding cassette, subfamily C, CydCD [Pedococcus cremeus]|uniref:ATP-binding cassette, subfamily C, CydD/ATP-binding cassette, subfamily C, CydCD n=1 Tax=Pedococcus cremeus TaxID=587636 RepID=A0A1H9XQN7_9MICO|nr:thiol reductant ABC exporter subunit CydD [Pedococcus cremeus]SES48476.1 ATP-binding cassette, subfamily C, CydD/ATP-binding cassette, subfamily C, CydCD [Pedococcus cremeus]